MTHVICEPCVGVVDGACVPVCPVDSIRGDAEQLYIDPEYCIDCASCIYVCPVDAIYQDEDVPPRYEEYLAKNAAFFERERAAKAGIEVEKP